MTITECPICGKPVKAFPSQKRTYCSIECLRIGYRERLKGEGNPNYRHGPKFCQHCGGPVCDNAKSPTCKNCVGLEKTGEKNHFFGKRHSDETRKKMSHPRPEFAGENNPFFGKTHSAEMRAAMSKREKDRWNALSEEDKEKRKSALRDVVGAQLQSTEMTLPERIVAEALTKMNLGFKRNEFLYHKFFVDFLLDSGIIIEVFGDYWHANPKLFPDPNPQQTKQAKKDVSRLAYLRACHRTVLVFWEDEIKTNIASVCEAIQENVLRIMENQNDLVEIVHELAPLAVVKG